MHELGYTECAKSYVFRGTRDYTAKVVQEMLGLSPSAGIRPNVPAQSGRPPPSSLAARFLLPVSQCEFQLTSTLEQLQKDPWPVANDKRSLRCTGVALSVATGLLETLFQNAGGRILLFAGGPATEGPGQVVGPELREPIRSHHDIDHDNIKYYKKSLKVSLVLPSSGQNLKLFSSMMGWLRGRLTMATLSIYSQVALIRLAFSR